jgi:hypothetical protein
MNMVQNAKSVPKKFSFLCTFKMMSAKLLDEETKLLNEYEYEF